MKEQTDKRISWLLIGGRRFWQTMLLTVVLGSLAAGCAAALMYTSGELISRSALRPDNVLMVYVPIVLVRAFGFGKAALQYAERLAGHHAALRALSAMRVKLYRLLERQAVDLKSRYRTGQLLGLLADDIEQLQNVYLRVAFPALSGLAVYGGVCFLLADSAGLAALWLAAYGGVWLLAVPLLALWRADTARRASQPHRALLYSELADAWFGMTDWTLSGRTAQAIASFRQRQAAADIREKALRRMEWRRQWLSRCAAAGAVLLTALWVSGELEAGRMEHIYAAACVLAVFPLMETLAKVNDAVVRLPDYRVSLQRLAQVEADSQAVRAEEASKQVEPFPVLGPVHIEAKRIGYRYASASGWALRDVSLSLPQGSKVAVLGRSGAGKSTLLQLLCGQRAPAEGRVTVRSLSAQFAQAAKGMQNAQDMQDMQAELAGCFSFLDQKPHLFHTTVANNVRLGRSDASDEEIRQALRRVGLEQLVDALPAGLDTPMEEAGSRFSGGERQRIALARILLASRPVVLLDEPTTGLDRRAELDLIRTLFAVLEERTVVWFTHRLTGIEAMDEIVFLERGTVVMRGTHEELMSRYERYRRLYELDHL